MIKFKDGVAEDVREKMLARYQTIAEECGGAGAGILHWEVKSNLDQRKGWHLVEVAVFRDPDALLEFRLHPVHAKLAGDLSLIADWVVGDIKTSLLT